MDQTTITVTNEILMMLGVCLASGWVGYWLGYAKNMKHVKQLHEALSRSNKLMISKTQLYKAALEVVDKEVEAGLVREITAERRAFDKDAADYREVLKEVRKHRSIEKLDKI